MHLMEKSYRVQPDHLPRSRMVLEKEREPRSQRQRVPKAGRQPEEASARKEERPQKGRNDVKVHQETKVKLKSTVVDIDSVRNDEVKEQTLGLLEAAEQDGTFFCLFK